MKQQILVVDNDQAIRDAVSRFLEGHGYEAFTASNAEQAFQVAEETVLSLVILDIEMGDESGLDLLAIFKATYPGLPVIMLTGMGFREDLWQAALQRGADGYTSKALVIDQLLMDIHRVLRERKVA